MAASTSGTSSRSRKSNQSEGSFPQSPLGATPRPDLRQHYPSPPPPSVYKLNFSLSASDTADYDSHETAEFTQLREKPGPAAELEGGTGKSLIILALIFLCALLALGVVYASFPKLEE